MPADEGYVPIHVGKEGKEDLGFLGDDTGEHISGKNANYCELTALYWIWKNASSDVVGLCHYRRYFSEVIDRPTKKEDPFSHILHTDDVNFLLEAYDVILPKKRDYYIESVWSHYKHAHHIQDLAAAKGILMRDYPEYVDSFNKVMNGRKLHLYNMFIMKKELFNEYAQWLFAILKKLEEEIHIEQYSPYQARVFGFISERLFNVWIHHHQLQIKMLGIVSIEKENKLKKYISFLSRKIRGNSIEAN